MSLSRYANGRQDIGLHQLLRIASSLGCSLRELVDDREDLTSRFWQEALRRQKRLSRRRLDKSWVPRALLAARAAWQNAKRVTA